MADHQGRRFIDNTQTYLIKHWKVITTRIWKKLVRVILKLNKLLVKKKKSAKKKTEGEIKESKRKELVEDKEVKEK